MPTKLVLTQPEPAITEWAIARIVLDWDLGEVFVQLRSNTGATRNVSFNHASEWIDELTAAGSAESLECMVLRRLVADGHLDGTIVEEPEEEEAQA